MVALSSAEAEIYAGVRTAGEALAMQAFADDLGMKLEPQVLMDASAAIAIMAKGGLTKIRHVETKWFWTQEAIRRIEINTRLVRQWVGMATRKQVRHTLHT